MKDELNKKEVMKIVAEEVARIFHQQGAVPRSVKQRHLEADMVFRGTYANRPNGSTEVKVYFATDTGVLYIWNGSSWVGFARIPASLADYTTANVTPDRSYDADATSDAEVADVLGTLIADLQSIGLIT